jgi:hypothetical protein
MNHLLSLPKRVALTNSRLPVQTAIRTALNSHDWRPKEEVPVSAEDRAATAKKYNMLPEDYRPLPPEACAGDMPDVAPAGAYFDRDPWEDYDYPLDRQNWNEPRHPLDHVKYDKFRQALGPETSPDVGAQLLKLLILPAVLILGSFGLKSLQVMTPTFLSPRVQSGVVHYSFEKDDGSGHGVRY